MCLRLLIKPQSSHPKTCPNTRRPLKGNSDNKRMTPQGYEMTLQEAWANFPTANLFDDTLRMNAELAAHIRITPSQYYWVHKRFKTRPEGQASVYKNAAISR